LSMSAPAFPNGCGSLWGKVVDQAPSW
jgi:hypothetical protein